MAIASLVCGILGIIGGWLPVVCYFTTILAILGIVFGVKARKDPTQSIGMANAGLVCGIIGTVFSVIGSLCAIVALCTIGSIGTML